MTKIAHDILKTKANKIRRLKKELISNPNNSFVKSALAWWESNDRKKKNKTR